MLSFRDNFNPKSACVDPIYLQGVVLSGGHPISIARAGHVLSHLVRLSDQGAFLDGRVKLTTLSHRHLMVWGGRHDSVVRQWPDQLLRCEQHL